jgi:hypothetical protein
MLYQTLSTVNQVNMVVNIDKDKIKLLKLILSVTKSYQIKRKADERQAKKTFVY